MIKLQRNVAEPLLALAMYMERDYSIGATYREIVGRKHKAFSAERVFATAYREGTRVFDATTWQELTDPLIRELSGNGGSEAHHPALIDQIIEIITGPYAKNVLGGRGLKLLQKAILLPEDMTRLGENAHKELYCANCGHAFAPREMATAEQDENNSMVFYCQRCITPNVTACRHPGDVCDNVVAINPNLLNKVVQNADCGAHSTEGATKAKKPSLDEGIQDFVGQGRAVVTPDTPLARAFGRQNQAARQNAAATARIPSPWTDAPPTRIMEDE